MSNNFLTISMITREALMVLENNLTFAKQINRQYDDSFGVAGAKIGTVLNVRKPPRYVGRRGPALSTEDVVESQVPVTLNTQYGCDVTFTSQDLALSIDDFSDRIIKPAIASIANAIDYDGLQQYLNIWNAVGTPGTVPNSLDTYLNAGVALDNSLCPRDNLRSVVMNPAQQAALVSALKGLFHESTQIDRQYLEGTMGRTAGFKFSMDQNVGTQTYGAQGGTPQVNGASQTGATLLTKGWTASVNGVVNQGDLFTIAGVNQVNLQNRKSIGVPQIFVATATVNSDGSGNASIPISPSLIPLSGGLPVQGQTVDNSPANSAAITMLATGGQVTPQALAFHRDAFTFACADLPLPKGVDIAARVSDKKLGMSIRLVRAYNISTDQFPCRLDVLGGWSTLRPELACRIQG